MLGVLFERLVTLFLVLRSQFQQVLSMELLELVESLKFDGISTRSKKRK